MNYENHSYRALVRVKGGKQVEDALSRAADAAVTAALADPGKGVLISRIDESTYKVELSSLVPAGVTAEQDLWERPSRRDSLHHLPGRENRQGTRPSIAHPVPA
ncbi:MAG: hypothetical protein ABWY04_08475 [Arthrobacter sp.]